MSIRQRSDLGHLGLFPGAGEQLVSGPWGQWHLRQMATVAGGPRPGKTLQMQTMDLLGLISAN